MALFSPQPSGPSGSAVTPKQPVQQPGSIGMDLAKMGAGMLPTAQQRAASAASEQQAQVASSAAQLTQQQLEISDAVDGGRMSSSEGRRRMRVLYSNALASNPAALDELNKAQKAVMSTSGLGQVVAEGTREEQQYFELEDKAMADGFIRPGMSEGERQGAVEAWQEMEFHKGQLDMKQKELTYRRGMIGEKADTLGLKNAQVTYARNRLGLSTDNLRHQESVIQLQDAKDKRQARQALAGLTQGAQRQLRTDWQDLGNRIEAGEISPEQAITKMDNDMMNMDQYRNDLAPDAGGDYADSLLSPIQRMRDTFAKRFSGELSTELMNQQVDLDVAIAQSGLMEQPGSAAVLGSSRLFQNADLTTMPAVNKMVSDFIGQSLNSEGGGIDSVSNNSPEQRQARQTSFSLVKDNIKALQSGNARDPEGTEQQVNNYLNKTLKGLDSYGYAADEPEQFNDVMDFLASSEYGDYVTNHGTGLNQNSAVAARGMVEQQYMDKVIPVLEKEWRNANVQTSALGNSGVLGTSAQTDSTSNVIEPVWTGSGVMFRAKSGSNARVGAKVRDLNKNMGPIVNRLIKAGAHLEGNSDYKSQWDNNFSGIFGDNSQEDES